ncbi:MULTISPECIES: MerR family DNA-binding protein [unclassified Variovorax]|uniref:MerR family DNA-binding protein n=1 Tax=unclassified Variovorax TaxID=663243 RepID=UPI0008BBDC38|nr:MULTISPECIES: MerR family DNA-binding protein [unclassified Variovorax]SEK15953.1 DNA-binding transcriptional regulator, MerR family [Variovorax sp. OK202]SFE25841.1 DNA-binding transcriptional regulator, MerR family [Variovorax sp. OK212]
MNPRTHDTSATANAPQARPEAGTPDHAADDGRRFGIDELMARAGVSQRLLHQCEARGLLRGAGRIGTSEARYTQEHISVLRFTRRAYALGFGMSDIARLLALRQDTHRMSADVKRIALTRTEALESRIEELQAAKRVLERLASLCLGDHQPACPILDELLELKGFALLQPAQTARPVPTASAAGCRCAPASR